MKGYQIMRLFCVELSVRKPMQVGERPTPRYVCEHPRYAELCSIYAAAAQLQAFQAEARLVAHKEILQECGRIARNQINRLEPMSPYVRCSTLESVARAVWYGDKQLAEI